MIGILPVAIKLFQRAEEIADSVDITQVSEEELAELRQRRDSLNAKWDSLAPPSAPAQPPQE